MSFENELRDLINRHSLEGLSNTPDYVLASYLVKCMEAFNVGVRVRSEWHTSRAGEGAAANTFLGTESVPVKPAAFTTGDLEEGPETLEHDPIGALRLKLVNLHDKAVAVNNLEVAIQTLATLTQLETAVHATRRS